MNLLPVLERLHLVKASLPRGIQVEPPITAATTMGRPSWSQSPLTDFNPWFKIPQHQNLRLYEQLVETVPLINAALERLVQLVGCPNIETEDEAGKEDWQEWWDGLRVNRVQRGGENWFSCHCIDHLVYGRAHAEIILAASGRDIFGLQELHTRTIELRPKRPYGVDLVQNIGLGGPIVLNSDLMLSTYHDVRNDSPQGNSLLYGLVFVCEIYARMLTSLKNTWERYGVPSYHANYEPPTGPNSGYSDPTGIKGNTIAGQIAAQLEAVAASRAEGGTRDLVTVGKVMVDILGAAGAELDIVDPGRHILEQIVAKTGLPPMVLALQWQAGERIGQVQLGLLGELIDHIRDHMEASLRYLFTLRQAIVGRPFEFDLSWEAPTLMDAAEQAKADLSAAQARGAELKYHERLWTLGIESAEDVARAFREELEDKTDAEVHAALPRLLATPPVPPAEPFGGGGTGNGQEQPSERPVSGVRGLDSLYSAKAFGNGKH